MGDEDKTMVETNRGPEDSDKKVPLKFGYIIGVTEEGELKYQLIGDTDLVHLLSLHTAMGRIVEAELEMTEPSPLFIGMARNSKLLTDIAQTVAAMGDALQEIQTKLGISETAKETNECCCAKEEATSDTPSGTDQSS